MGGGDPRTFHASGHRVKTPNTKFKETRWSGPDRSGPYHAAEDLDGKQVGDPVGYQPEHGNYRHSQAADIENFFITEAIADTAPIPEGEKLAEGEHLALRDAERRILVPGQPAHRVQASEKRQDKGREKSPLGNAGPGKKMQNNPSGHQGNEGAHPGQAVAVTEIPALYYLHWYRSCCLSCCAGRNETSLLL